MSDLRRVEWLGELPAESLAALSAVARIDASATAGECIARLARAEPDAVVIDGRHSDALSVLARLAQDWPELGLLFVTPSEAACSAASRLASVEWLSPPLEAHTFQDALARAVERTRGAALAPPRLEIAASDTHGLVGDSSALQAVRELVARVAPSQSIVLLRGETGTGKELVARAIHRQSQNAAGPFIAVHAAALPDELLESELFGYEKGAFTGATARKLGRVELAQGGTLFLDEVAEISPRVQAKLLRLLQEREFSRLGGNTALRTDARFVAATHRDLEQMVARGEFRQDLFYRLNVMPIWLPPLRARRDDIEQLACHFLRHLAAANGKSELELDASALRLLRAQRWSGNVRELQNLIERLVVLCDARSIDEHAVRRELEGRGSFATESNFPSEASLAGGLDQTQAPVSTKQMTSAPSSTQLPLRDQVQRAERLALERALQRAQGNRTQAARLLGVGRRTLYTKLQEHGLLGEPER